MAAFYQCRICACLDGLSLAIEFASLAVANGQLERGLRLFTWANPTREAIMDTCPSIEQADVDQDLAIIQSQLDEAIIVAAQSAGQALTLEQAIAEALSAMA